MAYDELTARLSKQVSQLEQALAEKDREITHLQDFYTEQRHKQEDAYQQLMAQAVGLAETVLQGHRHRLKTLRIVRANASITLADKFLNSTEAQAFLKEHQS